MVSQTTQQRFVMAISTQPRVKETTLGDFAYAAVQKHYQKSIKHEADVLTDRDPEPLHQMRVGLRRLRTALHVFDFALCLPKSTDVKQIQKFAHVLGDVRDLDILEAKLHGNDALSKTERKTRDRILKHAKKERSQKFETLEKTLHSSKYDKFKAGFEDWLHSPEYSDIAALPIQHVLADLLLPLISSVFLHPAWLFGTHIKSGHVSFDFLSDDKLRSLLTQQGHSLHDLRKKMKQVRYQTDLFVELYGDDYAAQVNEFKEIQDALGEIQDSVILNDFLESQLDDDPQTACPILWAQLDYDRNQAWQQWRSFQKQYLQAEVRTKLRVLLCTPSKNP
ncbi:CHAD domain-containing protein [Myxacorys almedinensis]|uniref:CHAD domain-containing protein n=1 Tax=Myxacorys almedinensis A TaxID=2690445 RepID=A0A8J7Z8R8_9CYAN|nr:CHAD domain-containing protein [Myxacorys almedinensis]NDJ18493.1 CHAD domain-containing protein [Myxacorys almedinensis A]